MERIAERKSRGSRRHAWLAREGVYLCATCGSQLLIRENKPDSSIGWPAFIRPVGSNITTRLDPSEDDFRTEIVCTQCHSHLGRVVRDESKPKALRYCIDAVAVVYRQRD